MQGAVLYGLRDIRFEDRAAPKIEEPTDAIIRIAVTCVCGSDLWPYRGLQPIDGPHVDPIEDSEPPKRYARPPA